MRVIVILFLGIAVIALVLKFFPDSGTEGSDVVAAAESSEAPAERGPDEPRVLRPPAADRAEGSGVRESGSTGATPIQRAETLERRKPPAPRTLRPAASLKDTPELAGALLHRSPEAFGEFLERSGQELPEARRRLLRAFSLAIAGRGQDAVELAGDLEPGEGGSESEFALLEESVAGAVARTREASAARTGTVECAMELALLAREGKRHLDRREWKAASEAISAVLLGDVRAPWRSELEFTRPWAGRLNEAQEHHRWNPTGDWPFVEETVQPGDSLSLIRSRVVKRVPGLLMCTGLIDRVNEIGDRYLQAGETLRIPTDPTSTLVDLEAKHVFFLFDDEVAAAWPVAIGAPGSETPEGRYEVGELISKPSWFRPGETTIPYGDPGNELGTRWIGWNDENGVSSHYGFHGTWDPETIGQAVSDGCIRLRNEDVEVLFLILPRGTPITVQA